MIVGLYLILTNLCRFVEETYRGEPQTPIVAGMRFYQWLAIEMLVLGALFTSLRSAAVLIEPQFNWQTIIVAVVCGLFSWFAYGVDFPRSNIRFSRLV
jgi:hypothetical protein